jgi:hypothetical protein
MSRAYTLFLAAITTLTLAAGTAGAQTVLSPEEAAKIVAIKDLKATPESVSGVVVNNTPHIIRDIEVLVEYHWLWANEFKPGPVSPGRAINIKLDKELRPGETTAFRYSPDPPLSRRSDGEYYPEVVVSGFTIVTTDATATR